MARSNYSADELEVIADDLLKASEAIRSTAGSLRESGMATALVHGTTMKSTYVPWVQDWIGKTRADIESQIRSYLSGVQSKAELHKKQTEQQKLRSAAAKKVPAVKATKMKAT